MLSLSSFSINNLEGECVNTQVTNLPLSSIVNVFLFFLPSTSDPLKTPQMAEGRHAGPSPSASRLHMVYGPLFLPRLFYCFTQ